jgi:SpoVK/Ycf46/Vps4 family AAA+-type ATPase
LDEAARRRFVKRIYIPLPDPAGRKQLLMTLMKTSLHSLGKEDLGMSKSARRWEMEKGRRGGDAEREGEGVKKGNERSSITNTSITVVIVIVIISQ